MLLAVLFAVNYHLRPGLPLLTAFEMQPHDPATLLLFYATFYGLPFALTVLVQGRPWDVRGGAVAVGLATFDAVYTGRGLAALLPFADAADRAYATRVCEEALPSLIAVVLPLALYRALADRDEHGFYGCSGGDFRVRPYLVLLAAIAPFVAAASFQPDFLTYYPRMTPAGAAAQHLLPPALAFALFEVAYLADFAWTELLFRGYFVIGLARTRGASAILPSTVVYALIHFAKPELEALGSIVGGYVLGVIALRTRSIKGGILVHAGVAALMEACALVQWWLR